MEALKHGMRLGDSMPPQRFAVLSSARALLILLVLFTKMSLVSQGSLREADAKAALLYNFAKFTTWPHSAFETTHSPLNIGVIGPHQFGRTLKRFEGKRVKGRTIEIRFFKDAKDYTKSHILFCDVASADQFHQLLDELELEKNHVLTVGDLGQFAASGGILGIKFRGDRLALELNLQAAKRARIFLSENLIRLTEKVN